MKRIESISGLLFFLALLTFFIPFIPFWSMSNGIVPFFAKIASVFFFIKKTANIDIGSFFVMFVNPAMFFLLYLIGLLLSFVSAKLLSVYFKLCLLIQLSGCIAVGFILKDIPLLSALLLPTFYLVYVSNHLQNADES